MIDPHDPSQKRPAGSWVSKLILMGIVAWIAGFGALAVWKSLSPPVGATPVESPFKPWDGTWEGEFVTYAFDGEPVSRLRVRQTYKHVRSDDGFRQEARFVNEDIATGEETTEIAVNTATFERERLRCRVIKDGGIKIVEHAGRLEDGCLFWSRSAPGAIESFREWINGDTYFIEGMGLYGDRATAEPLVFTGRYRRVKDKPSAAAPVP